MSFVVYNPTSGSSAEKMGMAPRVDKLQNGVLGVIDNGKTNSDTVLNRIISNLAERYALDEVVSVRKHTASHAIKDDDARLLAQKCNFILAGIGDWGSCSSGSLLDGIVMEKLGLPTVVVATQPFISSGKAMAVSHGIPDYPFAVIPHPIAATEIPILHRWADEVVDQVVSIWLKGQTDGL